MKIEIINLVSYIDPPPSSVKEITNEMFPRKRSKKSKNAIVPTVILIFCMITSRLPP